MCFVIIIINVLLSIITYNYYTRLYKLSCNEERAGKETCWKICLERDWNLRPGTWNSATPIHFSTRGGRKLTPHFVLL